MMKKLLLTAFTGILAYGAMAQVCTPDPNFTPSSATGAGISPLPNATVGVPYNEAATVVIPTGYNYNGIDVDICKVRIDSVTNFPQTQGAANYTLYYNGSSVGAGVWISLNMANASDRACVRVNNTFTAPYQDSLRAWASVQLYLPSANCAGNALATVPVSALNNGNGIPIGFAVVTAGIEESISNSAYDVAQNFPNPFSGQTQIAFNLPSSGKAVFRITNLVGATIQQTNISGNSGVNYINVNAEDFAAGVYMYSVTFEGRTITKRMIIK